ncbi:TIGR03842 family LLM class F420-dependent oxidoreductase [Candidatus Solirubrobacter pratensis]|uniref:TIGR03842 family LLM class F420-dependent oxidoreductase n=1 Tax=Candidatus Solirubrobacter pratensis TaxID=1298857 RepID=UPI000417F797|nr:TIGR03842 family LLM class F420-dependent oxidoreductase [Candidatus Solirubrobacter pratensis]
MRFGVTVLPDPPWQRVVELIGLAEQHGFDSGWTYDSPILWQEPYPLLTLMVQQTSRMRLGLCVTNPVTREPAVTASAYATLQDISGGRMLMGIGRGDSAVRVMGRKPTPIKLFEERVTMIKDFTNGREVEWEGTPIRLKWAAGLPEVPLYVAAYGPRALGVAGRVADGVIIQLADPEIIQWTMATARQAAEEAGRDPAALKCLVCAPSKVSGDIAQARDEVRWFPAMVGNHVADIIRVHGEGGNIPHALTDYIRDRDSYDYSEHSRVGAQHGSFVTDEICDRFCVIGSVAQVTEKLRELESIGVDEWIVYLMTHDQEETLEAYGRDVIPALASS